MNDLAVRGDEPAIVRTEPAAGRGRLANLEDVARSLALELSTLGLEPQHRVLERMHGQGAVDGGKARVREIEVTLVVTVHHMHANSHLAPELLVHVHLHAVRSLAVDSRGRLAEVVPEAGAL